MVNLLWVFAFVFVLVWALGFSMSTGGGLIHLLLVAAVVSVIIRLIIGRRIAA